VLDKSALYSPALSRAVALEGRRRYFSLTPAMVQPIMGVVQIVVRWVDLVGASPMLLCHYARFTHRSVVATLAVARLHASPLCHFCRATS